jgi:hypothetical protein
VTDQPAGGEKARPRRLGGGLPPMDPAPATHVLDR